jgi:hypothetical protein
VTRHVVRGAWVVVAVLAMATPAALAAFKSSTAASATYSTATLASAPSLTSAHGPCNVLTPSVVLTWTPSPSTWADGYQVLRSLVSGGPYLPVATVAGAGATTYTDTPLLFATRYHYVVRTTRGAWRSPASTQTSITTRSVLCT